MQVLKLTAFTGGWVVGDFSPAIIENSELEVAVKSYTEGAREPLHHHKLAREVTIIVSGEARMNGMLVSEGDVVVLEPGEHSDFEAVTRCLTTVIKTPSVPGDKYLGVAGYE